MSERGNRLGAGTVHMSLLAVPVAWGVNYAVIKAALRELDPLVFNGLRFALATLTVWALVRRRGGVAALPRRRLCALALLGVLGNTVYQLLFIEGIARTTAANASLIMASFPVVVALLCGALGRERLPALAWLGVTLAVGGLVLLLSAREGGGYVRGNLAGDLLVLAAAATWALYTVLGASVMADVPPLAATLVTLVAGTPTLLLVAVPSFLRQDWAAVGPLGWAGVAFSGIVAIGLAYLVWNTGLGAIGGTRTAVYSNLTPIVAAAVAWFALGERWGAGQFIGAAAVLAGITLVRRGAGRPTPGSAAAIARPAA